MRSVIRSSIGVFIILMALFISSCVSKEPKPLFTFTYLTDIHVQPERHAIDGFNQALASAKVLEPDMILTGGDLIMDALGQSHGRADSLYQLFAELTSTVKIPIHNTIGNHEVFGLYEKSGISPDHPEYGKQMFMNRMGLDKPYYSFDHKGWHFIMLDGIGFTESRRYYGHIDSLQLLWLTADLATVGTETPIIMSSHIPLVSVYPQLAKGSQEPVGRGYILTNSHEVMDIIDPYNVKLVLQGHLHHLEEIYARGIHFVTAGAVSARWWLGPYEETEEGFLNVEVYPDSVAWEYVDYGWEVSEEALPTQE
ncbi:MAG: metallophosphoesterase [Candidatus Marinimicrobia bacterium]|jgi:3',5'-cyclic AMP phosphodiesterase CpdA|nr:metallophosphoesterase [Candidatus Neomarinimicrobiota bacterium]MBT3631926.1 metallophosphoesterase [Candidatus Neomarinimicrobiota bacterium]MBT3824007.1 metallophosphoesterase [Candidatus Neomarinimicrobiota bacterium]MBT4131799.1 metallophosphoesterase [Candidatus Neomarinimicrobiota bacterium]MBT4296775.1 metallophosphoesterase [Candidatus Neomarinimicrobiota bacterium]